MSKCIYKINGNIDCPISSKYKVNILNPCYTGNAPTSINMVHDNLSSINDNYHLQGIQSGRSTQYSSLHEPQQTPYKSSSQTHYELMIDGHELVDTTKPFKNLMPLNINQPKIPKFTIINLAPYVKMFGIPSTFNKTTVIWNKKSLRSIGIKQLVQIKIIDERLPCLFPVPHLCYFYSTFAIKLSKIQQEEIHKWGDNFKYDALKKQIQIRSDSYDINLAFFTLLIKYKINNITSEKIIDKLITSYYIITRKKQNRISDRIKWRKKLTKFISGTL